MGFNIKDATNAIGGAINRGREAIGQGVETVKQKVTEGANAVKQTAQDTFAAAGRTAQQIGQVLTGGNDRQHDGRLVDSSGKTYPPGTPLSQIEPRNHSGPTVIEVNGIKTPLSNQVGEVNAVADRTGAKVVGIHNSTEGWRDLVQTGLDKLNKGQNPAVDSLAQTAYDELKAGRDVHIMGYSQGAVITSRALNQIQQRLMAEDGMTRSQAEQAMGRIKVETFGGAASTYPDGPQYVHYVNRLDPVPTELGLGAGIPPIAPRGAGRDAQVHYFNDMHWTNPIQNHLLGPTYLPARVPFEQARRGDFTAHPGQGL